MIDSEIAWKNYLWLLQTAEKVGPLAEQARLKAHMLKHVEGLLVKGQHNQGTPVTVATQYARADDRYLEIIKEEAAAYGEFTGLNEMRDTKKLGIGLFQTIVKDRS
jgi:hypothetical protein